MVERIETINGTIIYVNEYDEYHREDGPAIIEADGREIWYRNGKRHREDGPAAIYSEGREIWYRNGKFHREDGPAVILSNETVQWWLNGIKYSFNEWIQLLDISDEEKMELILRYG